VTEFADDYLAETKSILDAIDRTDIERHRRYIGRVDGERWNR